MTTWTCPACDTVMSIRPNDVGTTRPCAKCGQLSIVTDDFAVASDLSLVQQHAHLLATSQIHREWPRSILIIQIMLCCLMAVGGLLCIVGLVTALGVILIGTGLTIGALGLVGSAISMVATEVYRIRRYMEEKAKRTT